MFDHKDIDKYLISEIPLDRDIMLMSDVYMEEFESALVRMLEGEDCSPYEVGYVSNVAARRINANSVELSWYANVHTRFHEVSIVLPNDKIRVCVGCSRYDVKPYVFVDQTYVEQLYTREYVLFGLVDAIGIKNALRDGALSKEQLLKIRNEIDELASKHDDVSFISFADSLLLKGNWAPGYFVKNIECNYSPESFIEIIKELESIYQATLGVKIYAILSQGNNEYYDEPSLHISETRNHVCLNSLGIPFAELLAIDEAARRALKEGIHPPAQIYMDEQFYHSLRFSYEYDKNNRPHNAYKAVMRPGESHYFYTSAEEILGNLRD